MQPFELKEIILDAQKIREESWIENEQRYTLDMHESARLAVKNANVDAQWTWIVYLLNCHAWNDAQNWSIN